MTTILTRRGRIRRHRTHGWTLHITSNTLTPTGITLNPEHTLAVPDRLTDQKGTALRKTLEKARIKEATR